MPELFGSDAYAPLPSSFQSLHLSLRGLNLFPVILGNLIGGSVFVSLVYHLICRVAALNQATTTPHIKDESR